jgi:hypothetical protein
VNNKSIEDMAHDYIVAAIQSGKAVPKDEIEKFCLIAADLKAAAKKVQKNIDDDAQRRRW